MKSLKESLLNSQRNYLFKENAGVVDASVEEYINDNYDVDGKLSFYPSVKNNQVSYVVNCKGTVKVSNRNILKLTDGFEWGEIDGTFDCSDCKNLTSLEGAPKEVGSNFICSDCGKLTSLEGAPEEVGEFFFCYNCNNLRSLEGAPEKTNGGFGCGKCRNLRTLEGAPKYVGGDFDCSDCRNLTSLKGAPEMIVGTFDCHGCKKLKSLEDGPEIVGDLRCDDGLE